MPPPFVGGHFVPPSVQQGDGPSGHMGAGQVGGRRGRRGRGGARRSRATVRTEDSNSVTGNNDEEVDEMHEDAPDVGTAPTWSAVAAGSIGEDIPGTFGLFPNSECARSGTVAEDLHSASCVPNFTTHTADGNLIGNAWTEGSSTESFSDDEEEDIITDLLMECAQAIKLHVMESLQRRTENCLRSMQVRYGPVFQVH